MKTNESKLVMDSWEISWLDLDYIYIKGRFSQECKIAGGDFESMLSALCAVEKPKLSERVKQNT